jgi:hypothetical protein
MAVYYCEVCQRLQDGDYNPMVEHPYSKRFASYRDAVCCDECSIELEADMMEALEEDYRE